MYSKKTRVFILQAYSAWRHGALKSVLLSAETAFKTCVRHLRAPTLLRPLLSRFPEYYIFYLRVIKCNFQKTKHKHQNTLKKLRRLSARPASHKSYASLSRQNAFSPTGAWARPYKTPSEANPTKNDLKCFFPRPSTQTHPPTPLPLSHTTWRRSLPGPTRLGLCLQPRSNTSRCLTAITRTPTTLPSPRPPRPPRPTPTPLLTSAAASAAFASIASLTRTSFSAWSASLSLAGRSSAPERPGYAKI